VHLIHDPWLTVRKSDASRHRIRPCDVVNLEIVDVERRVLILLSPPAHS